MRHTGIVPILAFAALAACDSAGGLRLEQDAPFAPGVSSRAADQSVDGLIVGHRLMEAGQYELALKAYYRAAYQHGLTVDVMSAIGSANLKLGRLGQAENNLRKAITIDETFVPAWNNLGVVLMEQGRYPEAELIFKHAYALDSGESAEIRDNLRLALAKKANPDYSVPDNKGPSLVRRGTGEYLLISTP